MIKIIDTCIKSLLIRTTLIRSTVQYFEMLSWSNNRQESSLNFASNIRRIWANVWISIHPDIINRKFHDDFMGKRG